MTGCFGGYDEKLVFIKKDNKVKVFYRRSNFPGLDFETVLSDSTFSRIYNSFIINANKLFPVEVKGMVSIGPLSTTTFSTYIRKGNVVYSLPPLSDFSEYNRLKERVGIRLE